MDLYPNKTVMSTEEFTKNIRHELIFMPYANVVYVSALTQQRISRLPEMIKDAAGSQRHADFHQRAEPGGHRCGGHEPAAYGKRQTAEDPLHHPGEGKTAHFVIFCNEPEIMHFSYQRYLENQLREAFGFKGTPINIIVRGKNEDEA